MKSETRVGGPEALNIWFNNPGQGLLGWAQFPEEVNRRLSTDGVVCLHSSKDGGSAAPYNEGDTVSSIFNNSYIKESRLNRLNSYLTFFNLKSSIFNLACS